jgi:hypothetical protein
LTRHHETGEGRPGELVGHVRLTPDEAPTKPSKTLSPEPKTPEDQLWAEMFERAKNDPETWADVTV